MLSGSFPIFALSNHTTFSQTQTGATVPLIEMPYYVGRQFIHVRHVQNASYKLTGQFFRITLPL